MRYTDIKPLPPQADLGALVSSELAALRELWYEKNGQLRSSGEYGTFVKKTQRVWAVESGFFARLYQWERGVTETLVERGIDAAILERGGVKRDQTENIAKVLRDQLEVIECLYLFARGKQSLNEEFIVALYQQFTAHLPAPAGATAENGYKTEPNGPAEGGDAAAYCPPDKVADEMGRLVGLYLEYEKSGVAAEVLAAWLHHRFSRIRPFPDANGRVAWALAALVFLRAGLFAPMAKDFERRVYLASLQAADNGDLSRLVRFFVRCQRRVALPALDIKPQLKTGKYNAHTMKNAMAAALGELSAAQEQQVEVVHDIAAKLQKKVESRLAGLQRQLNHQLQKARPGFDLEYGVTIESAENGDDGSHFFRWQIVELANKHGYYANTNYYKSWSRLMIATEDKFYAVFSIHGYGHRDNGIMVISGFSFQKLPSHGGLRLSPPLPTHPDLFQFNHRESEMDIFQRFDEWFEEALSAVLARWRKTMRL